MSVQERRVRERARRERLIVTTARDLAEAEGWDAVTTRRLADLIEYSQPVLYSHFKGKDAIMAAVALDGFAELATRLRVARVEAPTARAALAAVMAAYADFAERHPALYDVMFTHAVELRFAHPETPAALLEGFGAIREALRPNARPGDPGGLDPGDLDPGDLDAGGLDLDAGGLDPGDLDLGTEVLWAALHGLVTLTRGGRLPRELQERRLALLLDRFTA